MGVVRKVLLFRYEGEYLFVLVSPFAVVVQRWDFEAGLRNYTLRKTFVMNVVRLSRDRSTKEAAKAIFLLRDGVSDMTYDTRGQTYDR